MTGQTKYLRPSSSKCARGCAFAYRHRRRTRPSWSGLKSMFSAEERYRVVSIFSSGPPFLEHARHLLPDVILLSLGMPGSAAHSAFRSSAAACLRFAFFFCRAFTWWTRSCRPACRRDGFVPKSASPEESVLVLEKVFAGERYLSAELGRCMAAITSDIYF